VDDLTHLEFRYARAFAAAIDALAPSGPLDALHIGGGGFTLPRYLAATRPGSASTVLELDPAVVEIGRRRLALETGPGSASGSATRARRSTTSPGVL
jgi:Spermidine synthase